MVLVFSIMTSVRFRAKRPRWLPSQYRDESRDPQSFRAARVAQPLLAARFSPLPPIHILSTVEKPAQPRVVVLRKPADRLFPQAVEPFPTNNRALRHRLFGPASSLTSFASFTSFSSPE